jgi:hypothetical protein
MIVPQEDNLMFTCSNICLTPDDHVADDPHLFWCTSYKYSEVKKVWCALKQNQTGVIHRQPYSRNFNTFASASGLFSLQRGSNRDLHLKQFIILKEEKEKSKKINFKLQVTSVCWYVCRVHLVCMRLYMYWHDHRLMWIHHFPNHIFHASAKQCFLSSKIVLSSFQIINSWQS